MLVADILSNTASCVAHTIRTECSQFLHESHGLPLYRSLPRHRDSFRKTKARLHKCSDSISAVFNSAFDNEYRNIFHRGVFAHSSITESTAIIEPHYIFPIDGYRYIYNKGLQNSSVNFQAVMSTLEHNTYDAFDITRDLIRYTYTNNNLLEGIEHNSEIIFFNIPYFYSAKVADFPNYDKLINRTQ